MKNLKNFEYLVGNNKGVGIQSVTPYDERVCNFLGDLSNELDKNKEIKNYPDIKTLAFWCRKKNILNLKEKFLSDETRIGLGLIFHITPSNIPTNFAYSLIFGLVTGNSNIIKVPSKKFDQIKIICSAINKILKKKKYVLIRKMISVVRYSNNDSYTKKFSSICNARLIWGGDKSINNIRKFSLQERALDIAFADRYSFCVINSFKIMKLNDTEAKRLAEKFYNDTYLVDQNACSSPHLIIWLGSMIGKGRKKFWHYLYNHIIKKYNMPETASIDKYTQLCSNILNLKNLKTEERYNNLIYTVFLKKLDKNLHNLRGKWGFFYEYKTNNINQIGKYINNKYQTLTYFGINKKLLKKFIINNNLNGIDRVVPIGQALDASLFWDGYDINKILSRIVDIK